MRGADRLSNLQKDEAALKVFRLFCIYLSVLWFCSRRCRARLDWSLSHVAHFQIFRASVQDTNERRRPFAPDLPTDVALLEKLWVALKPDTRRRGDPTEWPELGFQGAEAATDFRGMGVFGCESLVWFAQNHPMAARRLLLETQVPNLKWCV